MRLLVTGVGGFIGAQIAARGLALGHEVIGIDDFSAGYRGNVPKGCDLIEHDLAASGVESKLPARCDLILHLAGQSSGEISFDDPVSDLDRNVVSTLQLIRYGIRAKAQKIIHASSMSVYGDQGDRPVNEDTECRPLSCYGVGKLAAEHYLKIFSEQLPFVAFRMFNVYGAGQDLRNLRQGMVSIYLAQALKTGDVHVKGSLDRFRDFIAVEDVVDAWFRAIAIPELDNQILNLGTGRRTTVAELLNAIKCQVPAMTWHCEGGTPGDQSGIFADTNRVCATLGISSFTSLEQGLEQFVAWARQQNV
jgi:UDP-glucose 4-epimerase